VPTTPAKENTMKGLRFYTNIQGQLKVEENGKHDILVAGRFNNPVNRDRAYEYLQVAETLNATEDEEAAFALVQEARLKISKAGTADRFLEEVTF